jgi:hypothetical protein
MLDDEIWNGYSVAIIEGRILITALLLHPDYFEPITAVCLIKSNPFIQTTGRKEPVIVSLSVVLSCLNIEQLCPILLSHSQ